jgi:formylglycine-generating enzyme required for sulfatase activity/predicted esterase
MVLQELGCLSRAGFRIYYDEGIHPGHAWHEDLAKAIETCHLFVLFVSSGSIASGNCQRELNFALDRQKPILAIHLEEVEMPSGLQLALGDRQAIFRYRLDEDAFHQRMLGAVSDFVDPASVGTEPGSDRTDSQEHSRTGKPAPVPASPTSTAKKGRSISTMLAAGVVLAGLVVAGYLYFDAGEQEQASYDAAIAEIDALIAKDRFIDAYVLMKDLDPARDPMRSEYAERVVVPGTLKVEGEGIAVSFKPYGRDDVDWIPLGTTPFDGPTPLPRGELHFKLEAPGFDTQQVVAKNPGPLLQNGFYLANAGRDRFTQQPVRLKPTGEVPAGWVEIPSSDQPFFLTGWSRNILGFDIVRNTARFYVSKFEVTNAQYKEFVSAGGYSDESYWDGLEFLTETGETLSFAEAMEIFVDETGRPGPSTWALSSFAEGEADLPVTGLSWYEAAAYARFRNLSLPTIYQWARYAHGPIEGLYPIASAIEQQSNFSQKSLISATSETGVGPWGTYNTAGNAREWVWNLAGDLGLIQGSQWQSYGNYSQIITAPRMNRQETNGVRLVQNLASEPYDEGLLAPIDVIYDDPFVSREPVSDEAFKLMRLQFNAPRREPLKVSTERVEETELWTVDEHSLQYSENETFVVYVFQPNSGKTPYQTIIYGPPGNAMRSLPNRVVLDLLPNFSYLLRSGRAVVVPIWAGSYERYEASEVDVDLRVAQDRRAALTWYRDAVDTVNYVETLPGLDSGKLAYIGYSYGAAVYGQLVMAMEGRLKTGIFVSGGLVHSRPLNPFLDGINWVGHITQPLLQLNGIYDHIFPWEPGHIGFPENQLIAEIADWLDKYLGPVN